jgi:tRNA threonylcarbamoyladenosine biosynthesis protein TsaE
MQSGPETTERTEQGGNLPANLTLRPAAAADAAVVAALIRTAFAAQPVPTTPPPSALRETAESVAAHLHAGGGAVAEVESAVIGALLWAERDGSLYLRRLAVDPAWRRRGVARALLAAAEAEARRRGLGRLRLSTRLVLTGNRRLFAAVGFRETSLGWHEGFVEPTYVEMEYRLASADPG